MLIYKVLTPSGGDYYFIANITTNGRQDMKSNQELVEEFLDDYPYYRNVEQTAHQRPPQPGRLERITSFLQWMARNNDLSPLSLTQVESYRQHGEVDLQLGVI